MVAGAFPGGRGAFMNRSRNYVREEQVLLDAEAKRKPRTSPTMATPDPQPAAGPVPLARIIPITVEVDQSESADVPNQDMIRAMQRADPKRVRNAAGKGHSLLGPDGLCSAERWTATF